MQTQDKVALDRLVAKPLAWGFTGAAYVLGRIARRDHSVRPEEVRSIVVAKLLGMGSLVQATPLLAALKQGFPNARITLLTGHANRELVQRLPMVDDAIYLRDGRIDTLAADTAQALAGLMARKVDLYFDLEVYSAGASILALTSLARNRYGFYRHSARFKKGNYTHLVFFNVRMPVSRLYLQLYQAAGGPPIEPPPLADINVRPEETARMREKMAALGLGADEAYVVVNANASDLLLERRWPADRFAAAIEALTARGHRVVLIGSPAEAPYVGELHGLLSSAARARTIDSAGKIGLADVFALLRGAACVITNDTGPMHLAIAMGRPTVCLFGPGSPDHYGVRGPNVDILYKPVVCSPCIYETDAAPCDGNNVCMQLIEPAEVVESALRLLERRSPAPREARHLPILDEEVRFVDARGGALGVVARSSLAS
jgi:ADP-heptose:LPS heptosyltransferase